MLEYLTNELRQATERSLYYTAILTALTIPDICGALSASNGEATRARYHAWFDAHIGPKYMIGPWQTLTRNDCYFLRCSVLHQAVLMHDQSRFDQILFFLPPNESHNVVLVAGDPDHQTLTVRQRRAAGHATRVALALNVLQFCADMIEGVTSWSTENAANPITTRNYARTIKMRREGIPPFFSGSAVIA